MGQTTNLKAILRSEALDLRRLASVKGWEENSILKMSIPAKRALETWNRLVECAPSAGYYPVLTTMDNVALLTRDSEPDSMAADRDEALEKARGLTFDAWLAQERDPAYQAAKCMAMAEQIAKDPGGETLAQIYRDSAESWRSRPPWEFDPAKCPWPEEPAGVRAPEEYLTGETAAVLFVPTANGCEAPAHLLFGGFNACPPPEVHVAMLGAMQERYGARLFLIDSGRIGLAVSRRPVEREEALRLAKDFRAYAESFEGTAYNEQSEGHIAACLLAADHWVFWWD